MPAPQLKRIPLGTDGVPGMTTIGPRGPLPLEAEEFLARLPLLAPEAWADILSHDHEPLFGTLKKVLSGLKLMITPRRFRRRFDAVYSKGAEDRIRRLAESGALPMQHGWRIIHVTGTALQAICSRSALLDRQFLEMYEPFEAHIPFASLRPPMGSQSSSGRAGA